MGREGLESGKKLNGHNGVRHRGGMRAHAGDADSGSTRLDSGRLPRDGHGMHQTDLAC